MYIRMDKNNLEKYIFTKKKNYIFQIYLQQ